MVHAPLPALRWGLIGPGGIAHRFAEALSAVPGARLRAVLGRDAGRAASFAARWQRPGELPIDVATSLSNFVDRGDLDAVYIATPHPAHAPCARACLDAGLPVLCEKPLTPNVSDTDGLIALARERRVFLMEALWTRFLPVCEVVAGWLRDGAIGRLRSIDASFCVDVPFDPRSRLFDPALAGGAVLDVGIYPLALARWTLAQALGECPEPRAVAASARLAPTGVEQHLAARLSFDGGVEATLRCGFDSASDNALVITGDAGDITLSPDFWQARSASLRRTGAAPVTVARPWQVNGFEYEIAEATRCIAQGRVESETMPHAESLALARWMALVRAQTVPWPVSRSG